MSTWFERLIDLNARSAKLQKSAFDSKEKNPQALASYDALLTEIQMHWVLATDKDLLDAEARVFQDCAGDTRGWTFEELAGIRQDHIDQGIPRSKLQ